MQFTLHFEYLAKNTMEYLIFVKAILIFFYYKILIAVIQPNAQEPITVFIDVTLDNM